MKGQPEQDLSGQLDRLSFSGISGDPSRANADWLATSKLLRRVYAFLPADCDACLSTRRTAEGTCEGDAANGPLTCREWVRGLHERIGVLLWLEMLYRLFPRAVRISAFVLVFFAVSWMGRPLAGNLGTYVQAGWLYCLCLVASAWALIRVLYPLLLTLVRRLITERTSTDVDDILAVGAAAPVACIGAALFVRLGFSALPTYLTYALMKGWRVITAEGLPFILTVVVGSWVIGILFNRVLIYLLARWAARTEHTADDTFVRYLQVFGTFLILVVAGGIFIARYQRGIGEATGFANPLLPYSLFVGILTAVSGYASREAIESFFSSLLLQVDKPFTMGDRVVLPGGQVCDVLSIGMRTTRLYDIMQNAEISVPNRILANEPTTNISRPDVQLRIAIPVQVQLLKSQLSRAEEVLLDIAYLESEVDQARISREEISDYMRMQTSQQRLWLEAHLEFLYSHHPEVKEVVCERILGNGEVSSVLVSPLMEDHLKSVIRLRREIGGEEAALVGALRKAGLRIPERTDADRHEHTARVLLIQTGVRRLAAQFSKNGERTLDEFSIELANLAKSVGIEKDVLESAVRRLIGVSSAVCWSATHLTELYSWFRRKARERYRTLRAISALLGEVAECLYSIREAKPLLREHTQRFVNELVKEPTVHSEIRVTEEGQPYAQVWLRVFATHLERRGEITHKLNRAIEERFASEGIVVRPLTEPPG